MLSVALDRSFPFRPAIIPGCECWATAVNGNQPSLSLMVTYTDSTTTFFVQGFSDWFSPQNYGGETKAIPMGYRNSANGSSSENNSLYMYGYSFTLNSAKIPQSITLPNNANVEITAISLVPNWPPTFTADVLHPGQRQCRRQLLGKHRGQCQRLEWRSSHLCQSQRTGLVERCSQWLPFRHAGQFRCQHEYVRSQCQGFRRRVEHSDALYLR